jgi:methionine aminopeptidase
MLALVSRVILLPLDVGLHIGRRHQPHGVTQCLQFARPMVRRGAGFHTDQTWRQLLEERQHIATLQLAANDSLAASVNAVNLENRLGDV